MTFRTMLLTAAIVLPLAFDSTPVVAQSRRPDTAAPAAQSRQQDPQGIPYGHRPAPGMCRVWTPGVPPGEQPPPTPCEPESAPAPEPEPEPEPEPCVSEPAMQGGVLGTIDCNGVFTPLPGFPG